MSRAREAASSASGGQPPASADGEAALQQQMFSGFTEGVKPEVQERLSEWLPDVLDGGKKELKTAAKDLSKQEAEDLNALAKALDEKGGFDTDEARSNEKGLENFKKDYGEYSLKASTPQLAPAVSYDSDPTIKDTRDAIYDKFVSGLSKAELERLDDVLPDVLFNKKSAEKAAEKLSDKEVDALKELAKEHGIELPSYDPRSDLSSSEKSHYKVRHRERVKLKMLEGLEAAFKRDLALETTGELPTAADMLLVAKFGEDNGDTAAHIHLEDDDILKEAKAFKKAFGDLDDWLPAVLAGRAEMPEGDKDAKELLVKFAEEFGFDPNKGDDLGERAEKALKHLDKQDVIDKTLHPGKEGKDSAFLLFTDRFMESTLAYGAKNEALDRSQLLDAANVAEMLLGPDDGTDAPRELEMAGLQAAILHRTDKDLSRPQEVMAASGYINAAETLAEQKTRLTEVVLAFHVREEIGTPPMTPLQWAKNYADLHPEMLDDLGNRAFNAPTGEKLQIITQHLGVPGDHKFMVDKKRKIKMEVDQAGNLDHFDVDKKKKSFFKKLIDVAVPVIGAGLSLTGVGAGIGAAINVAYGAYKGAQAIKHGDLLGGMLNVAGSFAGGVAGGAIGNLSKAAVNTATSVANGINMASQGLQTVRAINDGNLVGALTGGLGTMAAGVNMRGVSTGSMSLQSTAANLQTTATGINTAESVKQGDFLQAGAGMASMAGDVAAYSKSNADTQFAFRGLEQGLNLADGIQEKNYAGIGGAAAGLIGAGGDYHDDREEQATLAPEIGAGDTPGVGDGPDILQAGYTKPAIEIAPGDTLSQIAQRHGTTVEALMAANPGITDRHTIYAGQQLTLPKGVQPVGVDQQLKLAQFGEVQGGAPIQSEPPRPGEGDPTSQPGATHPNAGDDIDPAIDLERANLYRSDLRLEQLALERKRDDLLQELDHLQSTPLPRDRVDPSRTEYAVHNELTAIEQRLDANQVRLDSPEPLTTVEIRTKPILGDNAGHAFAIVTDPYGNKTQTRGGPESDDTGFLTKDGIGFGDIITESLPYDKGAKDYNETYTIWPSIMIGSFSGDQADLINQAMQEIAVEVKAEHHQYYPSHQNSNSVIHEILRRTEEKTGLDLNIPDEPPGLIAPGWNTDLPTPERQN